MILVDGGGGDGVLNTGFILRLTVKVIPDKS